MPACRRPEGSVPHITPGNCLYFYQLLSQELGIGRQVPLPTVERLFAVHDLDPEDVDCSSVRDVLVALGDFVRLTVFKRGRVYVTLLADETYDGILSRQASEGEPRSAGGTKTWRHRRGAKDPRPAKPRHRHARQRGAQPLTTPDATPAATPAEPTPAEARERAPRPRDRGPETAQEVTQEPASIAGSEQGPRQTVRPHPIGVTVAEGARPSDAPIGAADRMQQDLPQDFPHEVFCKDEPLSLLYQLLPVGVDPMAELDEDWRLARATGSFEGTRSSISFVLHQRTEQGDAITAHLRRSARGRAGKHWTLEAVEAVVAPSHGHTIIHRLERELARHAVIGS